MIRLARIEDLVQIVAIYNEAIPERRATADTHMITVESRRAWFKDHKDQRPLWVYEKNREIYGWLSFQSFYGRPAYQSTVEVSIYVKAKFRREGIAKTLLEYAIKESSKLKISSIVGFIFGHNEPSINLFKGFGFEEWGYLPKVANLDGSEKDLAIYGLRI